MPTIAEQIADLDQQIAAASAARSTRFGDRSVERQDIDKLLALREELIRRSQLTTGRARQTFIRMADE